MSYRLSQDEFRASQLASYDAAAVAQLHVRSGRNRYSERFDLPVAMVLLEMIDQGYSLSSRGMLLSDAIAALRSESC